MVEAKFTPASPVTQYAETTMQDGAGFQNLFARAQAIRQQKEMFPLQLQDASAKIALSKVETQMRQSELDVFRATHTAESNRLHLDSTLATDRATVAQQELNHRGYMLALDAITPKKDGNQSDLDIDVANFAKLRNESPSDLVSIHKAAAALKAKWEGLGAINPAVLQAYHYKMAPYHATMAGVQAEYETSSHLFAGPAIVEFSNLQTQEQLNDWTKKNAQGHQLASMFNKDYSTAYKALQEKFQTQRFEMDKAGRSEAGGMAEKFSNDQTVQKYYTAANGYRSVKEMYKNPEKGDNMTDIAAMTEAFKVLDPNLGFTPDQEELFAKSGTIPQQMAVRLQQLGIKGLNAGKITPEMRRSLVSAVQHTINSQRRNFKNRVGSVRSNMKAFGASASQYSDSWNPQDPLTDEDMSEGKPTAKTGAEAFR